MRIVHILIVCAHGGLCPRYLTEGNRGVTGSEQAMIYLARESARRGHRAIVYAPGAEEGLYDGVTWLDLDKAYPRLSELDGADVVVSWLTADPLQRCRPEQLRVHSIQINDWQMGNDRSPDYAHVDVFQCVSQAQSDWLWRAEGHPAERDRIEIVPNGVDVSRFAFRRERRRRHIIYCSSPDRGLHWLLYLWPEIRRAFPDARLSVFYEVQRWIQGVRNLAMKIGLRARYIEQALARLEGHGVYEEGAVPPVQIAEALLGAEILAYPCDPVSSTEGFSSSTLEACTAGCVPIITDADALGEVYKHSGALLVRHGPDASWVEVYRDSLLHLLSNQAEAEVAERRQRCEAFGRSLSWEIVGERWHQMIERRMALKEKASVS